MALNNIDKLQPVKARAVKIRQQFNDIVQKYGNLSEGNYGTRGYESVSNISFSGVSEFNAGTAYIYDADNSSNVPPTVLFTNNDLRYFPLSIFGGSRSGGIPSSATNANNYHNLRGYLVPVSVADYVSGGEVHITRSYAPTFTSQAESNAPYFVVDRDTKIPHDDLAQFSDYIVPQITWYYEDANGVTQISTQCLHFWYFFTPSGFRRKTGQTLLSSVIFKYSTKNATSPAYFAFSPPYVRNTKGAVQRDYLTARGAFPSGYLHTIWVSGTERRIVLEGIDNAPYVLLINAPTGSTNVVDIDVVKNLNVSAVNLAFSTTPSYPGITLPNGRPGYFPAYKSVQDVIDLFDDYGIKLYTSIEDVQNPPPSEDGKINPDNPSEQIPYYPDNSTEKTPIEQAYITPSTFGQSCVYTPTTTKNFLRWICDNTVDISNWARLFANPADVIMGINLYNLDIVAHDTARVSHNGQTNILGVSTDIPNYSILDGYNNIVDGGTLMLQAYYGNYADFTSMTYQMFIPFVGFTSLRACDVVNHVLRLYYAVDFATGSAVAFVNSDDRLIYSSPCTVAGKIPLSTSDKNSQMINNTLSILGSVSGLMGGIASGNVGGGVGSLLNGLGGLQMQTNYSNKGSLSAVNIYKLLPAFIERTRYDLFFPSDDQQYLGAKYQGAAGAPSTYFDALINCANAGGFVQSDVVYLTSDTATEAEKTEIISLIKSGIYL